MNRYLFLIILGLNASVGLAQSQEQTIVRNPKAIIAKTVERIAQDRCAINPERGESQRKLNSSEAHEITKCLQSADIWDANERYDRKSVLNSIAGTASGLVYQCTSALGYQCDDGFMYLLREARSELTSHDSDQLRTVSEPGSYIFKPSDEYIWISPDLSGSVDVVVPRGAVAYFIDSTPGTPGVKPKVTCRNTVGGPTNPGNCINFRMDSAFKRADNDSFPRSDAEYMGKINKAEQREKDKQEFLTVLPVLYKEQCSAKDSSTKIDLAQATEILKCIQTEDFWKADSEYKDQLGNVCGTASGLIYKCTKGLGYECSSKGLYTICDSRRDDRRTVFISKPGSYQLGGYGAGALQGWIFPNIEGQVIVHVTGHADVKYFDPTMNLKGAVRKVVCTSDASAELDSGGCINLQDPPSPVISSENKPAADAQDKVDQSRLEKAKLLRLEAEQKQKTTLFPRDKKVAIKDLAQAFFDFVPGCTFDSSRDTATWDTMRGTGTNVRFTNAISGTEYAVSVSVTQKRMIWGRQINQAANKLKFVRDVLEFKDSHGKVVQLKSCDL